jgi:hypothetical protein
VYYSDKEAPLSEKYFEKLTNLSGELSAVLKLRLAALHPVLYSSGADQELLLRRQIKFRYSKLLFGPAGV